MISLLPFYFPSNQMGIHTFQNAQQGAAFVYTITTFIRMPHMSGIQNLLSFRCVWYSNPISCGLETGNILLMLRFFRLESESQTNKLIAQVEKKGSE
jgi:hypothetical protein